MCIEEKLVARALGNGDGNATLLVEAFSELCPHKLADHPAIVSVAYFFGFLPWGILVLIDFISPKWKSIRDTRSSGRMQLVFSLFPMTIVVAYATLQGISALGLLQLRKYQAWCADTLRCIRAARFPEDRGQVDVDDKVLGESILVNNSLVDNELTGSDVPVEFEWPTGRLALSRPESLSVRWTGAFLCALGDKWGRESFSRTTKLSLSSSAIWHLSHTTAEIVGSHECFSHVCIREFWDKWHRTGICSGAFGCSIVPFTSHSSCDPNVSVTIHHPGSRDCAEIGRHTTSYPTLVSFKNVLDSIVGSYPNEIRKKLTRDTVDRNRLGTSLDQVELTMIVKSIGVNSISTISTDFEKMKFEKPESLGNAWNLFCTQIGVPEDESDISELHQFWKLFLIPLWRKKKNEKVLQASAHVDIKVALGRGHKLTQTGARRLAGLSSNLFESTTDFRSLLRERMLRTGAADLFSTTRTVEASLGEEVKLEEPSERVLGFEQPVDRKHGESFLGVGLEAVRSFVHEWRTGPGDVPSVEPNWSPPLPISVFTFSASDFVRDFSYNNCTYSAEHYLKARIVWECQLALHSHIATIVGGHSNLPACAELIMFQLCSFPSILVFWKVELDSNSRNISIEDDANKNRHIRNVIFEIEPVDSPQEIKVFITLDVQSGSAEMKLGMKLEPEGDNRDCDGADSGNFNPEQLPVEMEMEFKWERWIEAAMGFKKGCDEQQETNIGGGMNGLRNISVKLSRPVRTIHLRELSQEIRVWRGWPVFDRRIYQSERDQFKSEVWEAVNNLGNVLRAQGTLDEAEICYQESLDMLYSFHGEDAISVDIASSLNSLGNTAQAQGESGKAEKFYLNSLAMMYSFYGEGCMDSDIASILDDLGNVLEAQEKLGEAEVKYRKSLAMKYSIHGEDAVHVDIISSLNSLGHLLLTQGKPGEAETMYRKSLAMKYLIHGEDAIHDDITSTLDDLGNVLKAQGTLGGAETMHRKSLAMKYSIYGEDVGHVGIVSTLSVLGNVLEAQGKLGEAEIIYRKSLSTTCYWEGVTRRPLLLDSDRRLFEVPTHWAQKFLSMRDVNQRLAMLDELEKIGQDFVEEMKKERIDAYIARMYAIPHLNAQTKVTIRGRIHSRLNPFVKEQRAKVHKVITIWLFEQIPFD